MLRRVAVCLTLALLVVTAVGSLPGGLASIPEPTGDTVDQPPAQTTPDGFSSTTFEIRLYQNSSARWTVRHSTPLSNETKRQQFESFAQRFTTETTQTYSDFQVRAGRLTSFGSNATDRKMSAKAFSRDARINELGSQGVIELSFIWTNFSRAQMDGVVAGDVFQGGMYIDRNQRLVFTHGENLTFSRVDPDPDSLEVEANLSASDTVTWFGGNDGRQFADSRPRLVMTPASQAGGTGGPAATETSDPGETATATEAPTDASSGGFGPLAFVVALLLLVGLGGTIAWYSGAIPDILARPSGGNDAESESASATTTQTPNEPAVPEEELLSDEDRVLNLLEDNGGRMKQVNIVNETEWSKSKVSMLLSDMEEEGDISKLRVGRENIISISGEEPDAVGSPFDDE